ncbi:MAG: T9SS type A sorting domain-containing protein, partial [Gemmatimonadota bacterium]
SQYDCKTVVTRVFKDNRPAPVAVVMQDARTFDLNGDEWVNGLPPSLPEEPGWNDVLLFSGPYGDVGCGCNYSADSGNFVNLSDYAIFTMHAAHAGLNIIPDTYEHTFDTSTSWIHTFWNYGMGNLMQWTLEVIPPAASDWFSSTPAVGFVNGLEYKPPDDLNHHQDVNFAVDATDLPADTYECIARVTSDCAYRPVIDFAITLVVSEGRIPCSVSCEIVGEHVPPFLAVADDTLTLEPEVGGSDCEILTIENLGEMSLEWSIADTCPWASPVPPSGSVDPDGSALVDFCTDDISSLAPSTFYACEFALESNDPQFPSVPVHVTLYIDPGSGIGELLFTRLVKNVPNPFNPKTAIAFTVAEPGRVVLRIYDLAGRQVRTLLDGHRDPERYELVWDGCDDLGKAVGSGVYYYRLEVGETLQTRKMVLLK